MKRKFSLIVAFCCFLWSSSVFVFAAKGDVIEGKVVCDDTVNLSGIEIYIDRFERVDEYSFVGNLAETVPVDKDGNFSFKDPGGDHFGCSIKRQSLPWGYGSKKHIISSNSDFYKENGLIFEIALVADMEVSYSAHGGLSYTAYDENGELLQCEIERVDDPSVSYEDITYEELKELDSITYKGKVLVGNKVFDWSGDEEIAGDIGSKIGYLRYNEHISLDKYYDLWLDYREDDFDGTVFECGTPIRAMEDEIRNYANQTADPELKERIIRLLGESTDNALITYQNDYSPEIGIADTAFATETELNDTSFITSDTEAVPELNDISETEAVDNESGTYSHLLFLIPCALLFALGILLGVFVGKRNRK